MATITEDYVSFEIAKLLKEKGFDCETDIYYSPEGELRCWFPYGLKSWIDNKGNETWWWKCVAPTLQMAMKWLREIHNIHVVPKKDFYGGFYTGRIYDDRRETITDKDDYIACSGYNKYEDATETAIKYCLENLI